MARTARRALFTLIALLLAPLATFASASEPMASSVHSLDGNEWRIATDPKNEGREAKWFAAPRPKAKPAKVPWIIQEAFPGYHGVAWYWRDFLPPANPRAQGRYLLRFWAVDYLAEVWLNGVRVGGHEGGETPFVLDVTDAIKPNEKNRLAVRVLNPTNEPIDGIILAQTARRCKVVPFSAGAIFDHGGITDSVELLAVPPIRVEDLWVIARLEPKAGKIHVRVNVRNAGKEPRKGSLEITVSPASSGETFAVTLVHREFPAGDTPVEADLTLDNPHLWELSDPYPYRVTAWVAMNATTKTIRALGITWPPGQLAFHPGPKNEYSVVRWTAPATSTVQVSATFAGIAERATTDVHVLYNGRPLFDALLNLKGAGNEARFAKGLAIAAGDTIDCVVGPGNEDYGADTTALAITIKSAAGKTYDATAEFSTECNPNGVWSYGQMAPGPAPKAATFVLYPAAETRTGVVGSIANPGSAEWQDILSDRHVYPRVPHTAEIIQSLRTLEGKEQPVFLSEYGIGSAVDLWRAVRHFEQRGAQRLEDAQFFNDKLNRFLADWQRWRLDEAFDRPEDFFMESLKKMASQRTLGLNAIRSNSNIIGHSLTGAIDHVMCGEGLTTLFRELKPGTIDALFDGWAPLRWCLFAEPVHVMRGSKVHLEAVLANEDVLATGEYPSRLQVVGPERNRILDRTITVKIPLAPKPSSAKGEAKREPEPPLAQLCFAGDVVVDGPAGKYRFLATFQQGAAAAGGETEFYLTDPAEMPAVETEIVLWGDDSVLAKWLTEHGIRTRPFIPAPSAAREVILASTKPAAPGGAEAFRELARRIACGATVVFIAPEVFAQGDRPVAWLPLTRKGTLSSIVGWLYLKDEWCKRHPIFEGMPSGGLMDYNYYREIIPDLVWSGQDPPAEAVAGAIKASQDYASGLMLAVYDLGEGRFILNTLRIRENLDHHPAAERLLRNLLRYAARDVKKPLGSLPADFEQQLKTMGFLRGVTRFPSPAR